MASNSPPKQMERCEFCKKYFEKLIFRKHLFRFHYKEMLVCPLCKIQYQNVMFYNTHMNTHSANECAGFSVDWLECYICGSTYPQEVDLQRHFENEHFDEIPRVRPGARTKVRPEASPRVRFADSPRVIPDVNPEVISEEDPKVISEEDPKVISEEDPKVISEEDTQ